MNINNFIVHVPHSSLVLPDEFWERVIIDRERLEEENLFLCDKDIDKFVPYWVNNVIKFNYSRLFCDVERFRDDNIESMSKKGMGAVYKKDTRGEDFISYDEKYKNYVLANFYNQHHERLENLTSKIISQYGKCYIIDLHSFGDDAVKLLLNKENNPDICIGVDEYFEDKDITNETVAFFEKCGYSVKINYPYSGTMVPTKYYLSKDSRVKSLMIEVNKRVYLYNEDDYRIFNECMENYFSKVLKLR